MTSAAATRDKPNNAMLVGERRKEEWEKAGGGDSKAAVMWLV